MEPYQERVVAEKVELDKKLKLLNSFFGTPAYAGIDQAEKARLLKQSEVMADYSTILAERIAVFAG